MTKSQARKLIQEVIANTEDNSSHITFANTVSQRLDTEYDLNVVAESWAYDIFCEELALKRNR